jgi:hypothetical protein
MANEKWEYCKVITNAWGAYVHMESKKNCRQLDGFDATYKDLQALNVMGAEGWELVSVAPWGQNSMFINAYMKRRVVDA